MKKKLILILGVLLLLGGGGGWWFLLREPAAHEGHAEVAAEPVFFSLPGFVVPIVRDRRTYGMIVVELALELKDEATRLVAERQQPILSDRMYVALYDLLGRRIMADRQFDMSLIKDRLIQTAEGVLGTGNVSNLMFQTVENRFAAPPDS